MSDFLRKLLKRCLPALREAAAPIVSYGFARPENPHDFTPDAECCRPEEIAAHAAACEAFDRGVVHGPECSRGDLAVDVTVSPFRCADCGGVSAYPIPEQKGSEWVFGEDGAPIVHILRAPWGIGTYTIRDPKAEALLADVKAALKASK